MPSKSIRDALYDIRDNIPFAQEFVVGLDYASFAKSRRDFYAVKRAIEIISEASRRLPDALRARHPHMPWRDIRNVGNFYRHRYDNVAEDYVWRTARDRLPPLLAVVMSEIALLDDKTNPT
jgi:uncharacterized protein with HEPN domain